MPEQVLTAQELEHLAEVREVCHTVTTAGWQRIIKQITAFVDEAYEDMFANLSSDPMSYMRFQLRWQQRDAIYRGIKAYVQECEDEKTLLLESAKITERSGDPTYASTDV